MMATGTAAYAQGQSSTSLTVSVRVIRSCVVNASPSDPAAPRITAQCTGSAEPRAEMTAASAPATAPQVGAAPAAESGFRVLTVNF